MPHEMTHMPPAVVLVEPQLGENIGAAARAMGNFGLADLHLVQPREAWPNDKAVAASAGADAIIERAEVHQRLEDAVAPFTRVYATTARFRDMTKPVMDPGMFARDAIERQAAGEKCAVLFGGERAGLKNEHLALADVLVTIPVNPAFASLNLAQAVLLMGYEWLKNCSDGTLGRSTEFDGPAKPGLQMRAPSATKEQLIGFYEHLEKELDKAGFLRPPEKRPNMVRNVRNLFARTNATEQEVRTLRGIVAALTRKQSRPDDAP